MDKANDTYTDSQSQGKLPLTFGVELEFLLAMRCRLQQYFPQYNWLTRESLHDPHDARNSNMDEPTDWADCAEEDDSPSPDGLWQVSKIFADQGAEVRAVIDAKRDDEDFDKFSRWSLCPEMAVPNPRTAADFSNWANGLVDEEHKRLLWWNFSGLELVSPALPAPEIDPRNFKPKGLVELGGYLKFFTHSEQYPTAPWMFISRPEVSSMHVHVGVQPQLEKQINIPIDVLRHVAFLCIFFEDTITMLHDPHRHSYPNSKCRHHAISNRILLKAETTRDRIHLCKLGPPFDPYEAFLKIFDFQHADNEGRAVQELTQALASKKHTYDREWYRTLFVNFENIANPYDKESKQTIEFRQHAGTFNQQDVNQWVIFVTSLVRTAERLMEQYTPLENFHNIPSNLVNRIIERYGGDEHRKWLAFQAAAKYSHVFKQEKRSLKQLFDIMQMPIHRRRFWWKRAQEVQKDLATNWAGKRRDTCDEQCELPPIRDSEGWLPGELDLPPWDAADQDEELQHPHPYDNKDYESEQEDDEDQDMAMDIDDSDDEVAGNDKMEIDYILN